MGKNQSNYFYFKRLIGRDYSKKNMQMVVYDERVVGEIKFDFNYYYHVYFCEFINNYIWLSFLQVNLFLFVGFLDLHQQNFTIQALISYYFNYPGCYIFLIWYLLHKILTFLKYISSIIKGEEVLVEEETKEIIKEKTKKILNTVVENEQSIRDFIIYSFGFSAVAAAVVDYKQIVNYINSLEFGQIVDNLSCLLQNFYYRYEYLHNSGLLYGFPNPDIESQTRIKYPERVEIKDYMRDLIINKRYNPIREHMRKLLEKIEIREVQAEQAKQAESEELTIPSLPQIDQLNEPESTKEKDNTVPLPLYLGVLVICGVCIGGAVYVFCNM